MQERAKIRNRIVITGSNLIANRDSTLMENIEEFIKQNLAIEVKIITAYKIGEKKIIAEMDKWESKIEVMKNKYKLKQMSDRKIYIESDLTITERKIQSVIRGQAEDLRKSGKEIKMGYQKMICDGKLMKWNKENGCLQEALKN